MSKSKGKIFKVKCRLCSLELLEQNYKEHIRHKYPEADENNLRPQSQTSLFNFCGSQAGTKKQTTPYNPLNASGSGLATNTYPENTPDNESVPQDKVCFSGKTKELPNKSTNISIDEKLDKIMEKLDNIELKFKNRENIDGS